MKGVLECTVLSVGHSDMFCVFWRDLESAGDTNYFLPHAIDEAGRNAILTHVGRDIFLGMTLGDTLVGYGLLRGWDEGFEVPSLGIAIHPKWRKHGLGRLFMHYLHAAAALRGAKKIRLRVHQANQKARSLYESMGYHFDLPGNDRAYLTGFKTLVPP